MMTLIRLGLAAFGGAGFITKAIVLGGLLLAVGTAYGIWHMKIYNRGYTAAIAAIAAQDKRAIDAAKTARNTYRLCIDGGGKWNQSTGECVKP